MRKQLALSVTGGSLSGLLFGFDIGAMSSAAPGLREAFGLSAGSLGFAMSAALVGTILGSVFAGFLADTFDRRTILLISVVLYFTGVLGAASSGGACVFASWRLACGIAIGFISVAAPMYLAEVSPADLRGRIVGAFQFCLSIGVVAAFAAGLWICRRWSTPIAWRYVLGTGGLAAMPCAGILLFASSSPRWLAIKGRSSEALSALRDLGANDPEAECRGFQSSLTEFGNAGQVLLARQHLRPILLAISIAVFNQLTGTNALLYYILDMFAELGSGQLNGRRDALAISLLSLVVTMLSVSMIDKVGRKPLLLVGTVGMGICLTLLPLVHRMNWPASLVVLILAAYNACFGFSQGVIVWVYLSEIFPLPVRSRGQSLGSTVHWVTNAIVVGTFPVVVALLHERVFLVLASLMVLQFIVILFFYPETKRIQLESLASGIAS